MMTELEQAISAAFESGGQQTLVNQVHRLFLQATLFLPIDKNHTATDDEPFRPLFAEYEQRIFMLVFTSLELLTTWAGEQFPEMACIEISGRELVAGVGEEVYLVLNAGDKLNKEFSPDEIKHLKKVVARIDELKKS